MILSLVTRREGNRRDNDSIRRARVNTGRNSVRYYRAPSGPSGDGPSGLRGFLHYHPEGPCPHGPEFARTFWSMQTTPSPSTPQSQPTAPRPL
jgi:hypothetical protein